MPFTRKGSWQVFYWTELREDTLHLHGLILKPGFRGQGIGTTVLNRLSYDYRGEADRIELGVYQDNTGAIRLYERIGFEITRNLEDLHFYIMQKALILVEGERAGNAT